LNIIRKFVDKVQILIISGKNNGYIPEDIHIYDNTSMNSAPNDKYFRNIFRENQNTDFML